MNPIARKAATPLAIAGILLALGGCASGQTADQGSTDGGTAAETETRQSATSQTFDGGSMSWDGKELTVELEANPATGYDWEVMITGSGLDYSSTSQNGSEQAASDETAADQGGTDATAEGTATDGTTADGTADAGVVGEPITETFTFTGTAKGTQTITMTYKRNWEATDSDKVLVISVATGEDGTIETAEAVMSSGAEAAASDFDADTSSEGQMATGADDLAVKDAGKGTDADVPNE